MICQVFTQDCYKIMSLFSLSPGSRLNRKEIKEKTRLNNVTLDKALSKLSSSEIIKREKNFYSINFENESAKKVLELCLKQYKQLKELPLDIFYLIVDLIAFLSSIKRIEVILFGSYAKLIYKDNSDLDLAILSEKSLKRSNINQIIHKLEKSYNKKIEAHYFEKKNFYKNRKDPLVKGILRDGVKLI